MLLSDPSMSGHHVLCFLTVTRHARRLRWVNVARDCTQPEYSHSSSTLICRRRSDCYAEQTQVERKATLSPHPLATLWLQRNLSSPTEAPR